MERRTFLELGTSLATVPFMMGAKNNPHAPFKKLTPKGEKAVVFIMLNGGNSHIDFTHANPNAINGMHAINGSIATKTPDLWFGADFTKLANISDKLNVVHSYHHKNNNHFNGQCIQVSGKNSIGVDQTEPAYGSFISKIYGTSNEENGLPMYLQVSRSDGLQGAWLGSAYNPYDTNNRNTDDLVLKLSPERFSQRLKFLEAIDKGFNQRDKQADVMSKLREQAVSMISGNIKDTFDISLEKPETLEKYGNNSFGKSLVMARRLLEAGGRFIHMGVGGWDMHSNISQGMKSQGSQLDNALSTFITDLEQRGMLQNTLIVLCSDFGRTPKLNNGNGGNPGRDHWGNLCSLVFAGGTSEKGRLIGKADRLMTIPEEKPFTPKDVAKTIFDHFDINNTQFTTAEGRPMWMYEKESTNILS